MSKPLKFRSVGFTDAAIDFPLSEGAIEIIAIHNGVDVSKLPQEFKYAPNVWMCCWIELLADKKSRGHVVRDGTRWLSPEELEKL